MPSTTAPVPIRDDAATAVLDALPRVSFRDRHHTVPAIRPAPGRYLVLEGDGERALLPLPEGTTRIGRGFSAEVLLEDQSVSRRHAILSVRGRTVRVLDDRSANGTFVNGRRVTAARLRDGDVLVLGRVVLTFRDVPGDRRSVIDRRRRAS